MGGHAPSASDWHRGKVPGFEQVHGAPQKGDVATDGKHVAILSGEKNSISVTSRESDPRYGHVVKNDWGFRSENSGTMTFWRYTGAGRH